MAQINKGDTFADGQQVTGARLNQLLDSATLLAGAITAQPSVASNSITASDYVLVTQAGTLSKATVNDILTSTGIGVINLFSIGQINGQTGSSNSLTIGSTGIYCNSFFNGNFSLTSFATSQVDVVTLYENVLDLNAKSNFVCNFKGLFNVPYGDVRFAKSLTIPVGDSTNRPEFPLNGNTRWNTSLNNIEVYYGGTWQSRGGIYEITTDSINLSTYDANVNGRINFSSQWYLTTGFTMYSESITVPVGEKWEFEYDVMIGYDSDDWMVGAWCLNGVCNQFYQGTASSLNPVIFTGATQYMKYTNPPVFAGFVLTAGTYTISYKVGITGGSGTDIIYAINGCNRRTVRKYKYI